MLYFTVTTSGVNAMGQELWQPTVRPARPPSHLCRPGYAAEHRYSGVTQIIDFNGSLYYVAAHPRVPLKLDTLI